MLYVAVVVIYICDAMRCVSLRAKKEEEEVISHGAGIDGLYFFVAWFNWEGARARGEMSFHRNRDFIRKV